MESAEAVVFRVVDAHLKELQITKQFTLESTLDQLGIDSVGRLTVFAELAEAFGVDLDRAMSVEGIAEAQSLGDLVRIATAWQELK
jgi:acyl carrier protein